MQEVVSAALDRLGSRLEGRPVTVEVPSVLAPMDFVLMMQVLVNLLDNALKYSPPGTPIDVEAHVADGALGDIGHGSRLRACRRKTWSASSTSSTVCIDRQASAAPDWD